MPDVLYEDNHVLVAVKPPNMLSQGDQTGDTDILSVLKEYIREEYNKPGNVYLGLVHRLDRPVGGLMVFARTSKAASRLSEQMRRHEMGLNQKQMAELLGVTQGMVSKYESGEYNFTIGTLNEICGKIGLVFEPVIHNPYEERNQFQIIKNETDIKEPHLYDVDKLGAIA